MKSKKKHMLKISGVYLIGNPEICQDPPSCGQDDQTLSIAFLRVDNSRLKFGISETVPHHIRIFWNENSKYI